MAPNFPDSQDCAASLESRLPSLTGRDVFGIKVIVPAVVEFNLLQVDLAGAVAVAMDGWLALHISCSMFRLWAFWQRIFVSLALVGEQSCLGHSYLGYLRWMGLAGAGGWMLLWGRRLAFL